MARDVADYVALALVADIKDEQDYFSSGVQEFSGDLTELRAEAEKRLGFPVSEYTLQQAIRTLADCGLVRITDDNFSGTFVKIRAKGVADFINRARNEFAKAKEQEDEISILTRPSDYPAASALDKHELFDDYHELGAAWLQRALEGLRRQVEQAGSLDDLRAPELTANDEAFASDRTVSISDNQVWELDKQTTEIIEAVEAQNQIDSEPGLRELVIGQLKAGRELVRAGSFKMFAIQNTLIEVLRFLVMRYENQAIGTLAGALLIALAKHMGADL